MATKRPSRHPILGHDQKWIGEGGIPRVEQRTCPVFRDVSEGDLGIVDPASPNCSTSGPIVCGSRIGDRDRDPGAAKQTNEGGADVAGSDDCVPYDDASDGRTLGRDDPLSCLAPAM